jgi:hypothetical protein
MIAVLDCTFDFRFKIAVIEIGPIGQIGPITPPSTLERKRR